MPKLLLNAGWDSRCDVHADTAGQDDVPCHILPHAGVRGGGGYTSNTSLSKCR